uniref:Uncharacterized protein n=1 Tax=Panagrolaimus superbus TaxID=310955 RepID=A0A914Y901_9BILA
MPATCYKDFLPTSSESTVYRDSLKLKDHLVRELPIVLKLLGPTIANKLNQKLLLSFFGYIGSGFSESVYFNRRAEELRIENIPWNSSLEQFLQRTYYRNYGGLDAVLREFRKHDHGVSSKWFYLTVLLKFLQELGDNVPEIDTFMDDLADAYKLMLAVLQYGQPPREALNEMLREFDMNTLEIEGIHQHDPLVLREAKCPSGSGKEKIFKLFSFTINGLKAASMSNLLVDDDDFEFDVHALHVFLSSGKTKEDFNNVLQVLSPFGRNKIEIHKALRADVKHYTRNVDAIAFREKYLRQRYITAVDRQKLLENKSADLETVPSSSDSPPSSRSSTQRRSSTPRPPKVIHQGNYIECDFQGCSYGSDLNGNRRQGPFFVFKKNPIPAEFRCKRHIV